MQITFVSKIEYKQYLKTELFFDMLDESNLFTKSNKRKKLYNLFGLKTVLLISLENLSINIFIKILIIKI